MNALDARSASLHAPTRPMVSSWSSATARLLGAAIGFLVATVPAILENPGDPVGSVSFGMSGSLFSTGLLVGPLLGAFFGPAVRVHRFRIGLLARMAVVAVLLGDALIVGSAVLSEGGTTEVLLGGVALYLFGLMFLGLPVLLATTACAAVWQGLMIAVLRLIGTSR